jgi:hypothetical protein
MLQNLPANFNPVTCLITRPESLVAIDTGIFTKSYSLSDKNILAAPPHSSLSSRSLDCVLEIFALPHIFFSKYECRLHLHFSLLPTGANFI